MGGGTTNSGPGVARHFLLQAKVAGSSVVSAKPNKRVGECILCGDGLGREAWSWDEILWLLESWKAMIARKFMSSEPVE